VSPIALVRARRSQHGRRANWRRNVRALVDESLLLGDRPAVLGPQRGRQLRTGPGHGRRLVEPGPGTQSLVATSSGACVRSKPIAWCRRGITRPGAHRTLDRHREYRQMGHTDAHSSAVTTCTTRAPNQFSWTRSTASPRVHPARGIRCQIAVNMGDSRAPRQAHGLALARNCFCQQP
jgi:hypothetical protein